MSTGLIAILDDVVAITKLAAASLDDAAAQAAKAGSKAVSKAAGIVIDDAAVTPRYVVGFAAERELPIIGKIATGSLKNKVFFLLPGALLLSFFAPVVITPLLMFGGAFLCYEGWHKVADYRNVNHETPSSQTKENNINSKEVENERIKSAIRTDFVLSAEIMAITLSTTMSSPIWLQGVVLAVVGLGMTVMVYGTVAVLVKLDDFGFYLSHKSNRALRAFGRGIVLGMPVFLQLLTFIGMLAMLWVGGGILIHGLHELGLHGPDQWLTLAGEFCSNFAGGLGGWVIKVALSATLGLVVGAVVEFFVKKILAPIFLAFRREEAKSDIR